MATIGGALGVKGTPLVAFGVEGTEPARSADDFPLNPALGVSGTMPAGAAFDGVSGTDPAREISDAFGAIGTEPNGTGLEGRSRGLVGSTPDGGELGTAPNGAPGFGVIGTVPAAVAFGLGVSGTAPAGAPAFGV